MILKIMQKKAIRNLLHANIALPSRILISEFPMYGKKCIEKLQSNFANMTFSDKITYDRNFQQVIHKVRESAIHFIKIIHNAHDFSILVENYYLEDLLIHTFLDNFHQCWKYSAQIDSHQAELRRENKFTDQKSLNTSSLQI